MYMKVAKVFEVIFGISVVYALKKGFLSILWLRVKVALVNFETG